MAQFGVTTALVSMVLSMFMAGLGAGSWGSGKFVRRCGERIRFSPLRLYALTELLIGISALTVPVELFWGHSLLEHIVEVGGMSSARFYLASGAWLAITLIPWCACMGATIPLAMFAIQSDPRYEAQRSFSFLYLANVLGAVAGTFAPLFLIELYGFHRTLRFGAVLNAVIFVMAFAISFGSAQRSTAAASKQTEVSCVGPAHGKSIMALLFLTGFATMGMELIWIRLFTPYAGPIVYSFALILGAYLFATFAGSQVYRFWSRQHSRESKIVWISLALLGLVSLVTSDPRTRIDYAEWRVLLGVMPFAGLVGFLTPMLVDRWSGGDPDRAGRAYAVNILGCIAGPLVSGFVLLPYVGERVSMLIFAAPWFAMAAPQILTREFRLARRAPALGIAIASLLTFLLTKDYETQFPNRVVFRDSTATVIATGSGMKKLLLVNGVGMTSLTPITKMMAHLALASLDRQPKSALVICFGMGTTFRSALSWGIPVTVVELVPSVPKLFTFFHPDGAQLLAFPMAHVVIDDGRRYLDRSSKMYDAIIIDPPPPVETAGSSLLYSQDFYLVAKGHLQPGGIFQQWLPNGDDSLQSSVARALKDSFPYVHVYASVEGWGWHFLASTRPIPDWTARELAERMPERAIVDMMEWGPAKSPEEQFELLFSKTMTIDQMIALSPRTPALQDDRPVNEYYLLRTSSKTWW
ncbi:MAG TPA: fused MFS/spermidine synthase [Candidatus Acidoferrales bacterium]|nr:fused MFS/spermidine synthase [Candidatus Acidoferrales bacterium]